MYRNSLATLYDCYMKKHNSDERKALEDFTTLCETIAVAPYRFVTEMREFADDRWMERNQ